MYICVFVSVKGDTTLGGRVNVILPNFLFSVQTQKDMNIYDPSHTEPMHKNEHYKSPCF